MAVVIWVVFLPGMLVNNRTGSWTPPWRPWFLVVLGAATLAVGCWLIWRAAVQLQDAGISPFAAHPGPVLLTDGLYARVRNPMDLGTTLTALAPAVAVDLSVVWIVPFAAFVYYAMGRGPLEHSYLHEAFGEQWEDYRAAVPLWTPLWTR